MRIDLFLWYSRIYKSRTISSNACKKGHVKINSKSVKPSHDIFIGTIFTVKKNQILNKFKILDLPNSRVGAKILNLYLMDITPKSENEKKRFCQIQKITLNLRVNLVKKKEGISTTFLMNNYI